MEHLCPRHTRQVGWGGVGVGVNVCGDYSVGYVVFPMTRINDDILV